MTNIWHRSVDFSAETFCAEGAARELLGSCSAYEAAGPPAVLAPYEEALVSLPSGAREPVSLLGALRGTPHTFLDGYNEWLLNCDLATSIDIDNTHKITSYCDPLLKKQKKHMISFVNQLNKAGILSWTRVRKGRVAPFLVWKKNGKQRLVLDCRQVNELFRDPPAMRMGGLSSLAAVAIPEGEELYISQVDIKDCFWQCLLPMSSLKFSVSMRWTPA